MFIERLYVLVLLTYGQRSIPSIFNVSPWKQWWAGHRSHTSLTFEHWHSCLSIRIRIQNTFVLLALSWRKYTAPLFYGKTLFVNNLIRLRSVFRITNCRHNNLLYTMKLGHSMFIICRLKSGQTCKNNVKIDKLIWNHKRAVPIAAGLIWKILVESFLAKLLCTILPLSMQYLHLKFSLFPDSQSKI